MSTSGHNALSGVGSGCARACASACAWSVIAATFTLRHALAATTDVLYVPPLRAAHASRFFREHWRACAALSSLHSSSDVGVPDNHTPAPTKSAEAPMQMVITRLGPSSFFLVISADSPEVANQAGFKEPRQQVMLLGDTGDCGGRGDLFSVPVFLRPRRGRQGGGPVAAGAVGHMGQPLRCWLRVP